MSYSGTTNQTKINVDQLISYAYRDAGKTAEEITPEYIDAGKQALYYILQNLSNRGVNLWLLENKVNNVAGKEGVSPEIQKIYDAVDNNKPIEWVRVHNLPDLAYFNHSQHVSVAGITCQECHGPVEEMEIMRQHSPIV